MNGYTKLFASIITSTIWGEDDQTRIVWITLLASADKNGEVQASIPGLARIAGVTVEACEKALGKFLAPDPYSRTKDDEGRRIEPIDGGWVLLNHAKYRLLASKDETLSANAERQRRHRERLKRNGSVTDSNGTVTHERDIADADADADAEEEKKSGEELFTEEPDRKKAASLKEVSEELMREWNNLPEGISRVSHMSEGRKKHLSSRLKDDWWRTHWKEALAKVPASPFLMGKVESKKGSHPFKFSIEFFLRPDTVAKIMEGKYDGPQEDPNAWWKQHY